MKTINKANNCKKYIVNPKNFEIITKIQSGGFSSVYKVQDKINGKKLAAKIINLDISNIKYRQMIDREISIMIQCQHPTIINIYGYSYQDLFGKNYVTIFMELAENGSLANLLQQVQNGVADHAYDNTIRQIILIGIARGMMHLHQHNVLHCDLKPGNILLDSNFHPHITDFGLSKIFEYKSTIRSSIQIGTCPYMAPEMLSENKISVKTDVYSFGILMYEVITDSVPYPLFESQNLSPLQFNDKVVLEDYRPQFTFPVKKSIKKLIERCWSKNPKIRPTFEEIFKKLAFNIDDSIFNIYDEDGVNVDNDDCDYYLDDVDVEEVLSYVDSIYQKVDDSSEFEKLKKENQELKSKLDNLIENEINPLKKENQRLKKENKDLKAKFENEINPLKKENENLKKKIFHLNMTNNNEVPSSNEVFISPSLYNHDQKDKIFTFKDFNSNSLQMQQFFISKIILKSANSKIKPIFTKINNLLLYLMKFVKKETFSFFEIKTNDGEDEKILNYNKDLKICLLSESIENLFISKNLQSNEFSNQIKQFKDISIEMTYPSTYFDPLYKIISTLKNSNSFNLKIFIKNVLEIDDFFMNKTNIDCVVIDSTVKAIKNNAFDGCSSLKQITIPSTVQLIKEAAFYNCSSLKQINLPPLITIIDTFTFQSTALVEIEIPPSVTEIGDSAFCCCEKLEKVLIPPSVVLIGDMAFNSCISLYQISLPPFLKVLGSASFSKCSSLTQISIPPLLTSIHESTFDNCAILAKVTFDPDSKIDSIGDQAFNDCPSLKQITIPSSVCETFENSFSPCTKVIKSRKRKQ